jgi:1-acyl-sn-glycerol-3-phosphate acyltransferase
MKQLDHLRRLLGTTVSFAVFGVAGLLVGLLIFPVMFIFVRDRRARQRAARKLIGSGFGAFISMLKVFGVLSYEIEGANHIDSGQNQLIVANHPTLIDVVILVSLFPQADCVIKEAVTRNPFMRSTVAAANYISNGEPDELLRSCVESLDAGGSLLLFPEGTRTARGEAPDLKLGAATVAARAGVDILPIAIACSPVFLTKNLPWHHVPAEKPHFKIRVLAPVPLSELVSENLNERKSRHKINDALLELLLRETTALERLHSEQRAQGST